MSLGAVPVTLAVKLFIAVVNLRVALGPCSALLGLLGGRGCLRLTLNLVVHWVDQCALVGSIHIQRPDFIKGEFPSDHVVEDVNVDDLDFLF